MEIHTSKTNFTTEQKVDFIIKVTEQQLSIVASLFLSTCNIAL